MAKSAQITDKKPIQLSNIINNDAAALKSKSLNLIIPCETKKRYTKESW
jgi:hypothetical protein